MSTGPTEQNILRLSADGPALGDGPEILDVIGDAFGLRAEVVVVPVERLDPDFFRLRTGVAGAIVQKFANYRLRLVVLGEGPATGESTGPVEDWMREANRGRELWFVPDEESLRERLATSR